VHGILIPIKSDSLVSLVWPPGETASGPRADLAFTIPRLGFVAETVANPANCTDVSCDLAKLRAKPAHVRVNGTRVQIGVVSPDILQQTLARLCAPAPRHQYFEKSKFDLRELDGLRAQPNPMRFLIETQWTGA
jgi:hypothetical protein